MNYQILDWGITQIDTGFYRNEMAACYLIEDNNEVAIVETGIKSTVDRILAFLDEKSISLEQVKYVIPTHVHLDHAGGVGLLMQALPSAKLIIHPFGARHMIDPSKLQAGAIAVYGEDVFMQTYGNLIPVDESDIILADDSFQLKLGHRKLTFYDTPGHARHHFCIFDSLSRGIFTGDTFGLAYKELQYGNTPFIFPTTTPVQFDPEAMKTSIQRLAALSPKYLFLTHYGMVSFSDYLVNEMSELINGYVEIALRYKDDENRQQLIADDLMTYIISHKQQQGIEFNEQLAQQVLVSDIKLNAQGLDVWLQKC